MAGKNRVLGNEAPYGYFKRPKSTDTRALQGINIEMTRQVNEEDGRMEFTWYGILLSFSCFLCGLFGSAGVFLSAFPVACNHKILYLGILAIGLFFELIWLLRKFWRWLLLFLLPVAGIACSFYFEDIKEGLVLILKTIQSIIVFVDSTFRIDVTAEEENKIIVAFLFIIIIWAGLLWISTMLCCIRTLTVLCLGSILAGVLAVGLVPAFWAVCLMMYCCLGNFAGLSTKWSRDRQKGVLLTLIIGFGLLAAGDLLASHYLEDFFKDREQIRARIRNTSTMQELINLLPKWENPYATGGMGNGELGQIDNINFTGDIALRVTIDTKLEKPVYLRGYIGSEYTGKKWEVVEDTEDEEISGLIYEDKKYWLETLHQLDPLWIYIERVNASPKYRFRPYLSAPVNDTGYEKYDYWYIQEEYLSDTMSYDNDTIKNYSEFVYDNYLSYPEESLPRLLAQCRDNPQNSLEDIKDYIVSSLDSLADYNLKVGRFPPGEEFTEYFLYEAKQGYCSHFATAAVLMFRMYGIPARYAEGYIAPPGDFHAQDDKYIADIADNRAHAWAEIYTEEMGWMPVEATPGYSMGAEQPGNQWSEETEMTETGMNNNTEPETNNNIEPPETSARGEESEKNKSAEQQEGAAVLNIVIGIGLCIWGILMMVFVIHLRRIWILRRRKTENVREIFYDMYEVLRLGGLPGGIDCQAGEFAAFVARRFTWINEDEFAEVMELVMRANFGRGAMSSEEIRFVRNMYRYICTQVYGDLRGGKRMMFRYWKAYN